MKTYENHYGTLRKVIYTKDINPMRLIMIYGESYQIVDHNIVPTPNANDNFLHCRFHKRDNGDIKFDVLLVRINNRSLQAAVDNYIHCCDMTPFSEWCH